MAFLSLRVSLWISKELLYWEFRWVFLHLAHTPVLISSTLLFSWTNFNWLRCIVLPKLLFGSGHFCWFLCFCFSEPFLGWWTSGHLLCFVILSIISQLYLSFHSVSLLFFVVLLFPEKLLSRSRLVNVRFLHQLIHLSKGKITCFLN